MKLDQLGSFVWLRNLVIGEQWNVIEDGKFVTETTDHNFVLALGGIVNNAAKEIHLIKMNKEGTELWHRSYANDSIKLVRHIVQTADGGFALTGLIGSVNADTARFLFIKTDTAGYVQWQKTYSMGNDARAFSVQQTPWDGGYILGGWDYTPATGYDMFVVKTDSIGDTLWTRHYGGIYHDCACQIVPNTSLQDYEAGSPIEYIMTACWYDSENWWESKSYIAKLDSVGGIIWQHKLTNYPDFSSIQTPLIVRQGGRAIGVATFENIYTVRNPVIVSFRADGTIEWSKPITLDPTKSSYIKDMRPTSDGGYVLAGYQYSSPQTAWVLKIDSLGNTCSFVGCDSTIYTGYPIGLDEVLLNKTTFSIVPNPTNNYFDVYLSNESIPNQQLSIYDINGRLLQTTAINGQHTLVNVAHLPSGMYYCKLSNDSSVQKLVIIK
jgi:hypothetical protein